MSKRQKLSEAEYRKRRANRQNTGSCSATTTINQFLIPATNVANEALNDPAQGTEQPELHDISNLSDHPAAVESISLTVEQDTVQLERIGQHDDVQDDDPGSNNDKGDITNAN